MGFAKFRKVALSENYSYKCKADQTLFSGIPLKEEARYLLAYSYIYHSDVLPVDRHCI